MAQNPYKTLGVRRDASDSDIRAAFRKLAKQFHPDRNPGDVGAEETFKKVSAAYDLLSDPAARKTFDDDLDFAEQMRAAQRAQTGAGKPRATNREHAGDSGPVTLAAIIGVVLEFAGELGRVTAGALSKPPRIHDLWRGGDVSDAGWFGGLAFYLLVSAATISLFTACNPFLEQTVPNRFGLIITVPVFTIGVAGALALMSREFLVFSALIIFFAWVGNSGGAAFPSALYFCSFTAAGGLLADGVLRTNAGAALTGYEWQESASPLVASIALGAFAFAALMFVSMHFSGALATCIS